MNNVESQRRKDTDRFYALLDALAERTGGARRLRDCSAASGWPTHGVYFFFQDGETRADGNRPRVVRVGTHALIATSRSTLWARLAQHRGHVGGTNPGGGNHRGSVFRLHVGNALLATGGWPEEIAQSWPKIRATSQQRQAERPLELAVTAHIAAMPLLWLDVPDRAQRGTIEANAISLLSQRTGGIDPPSPGWLGLHTANARVAGSGLWNSNHVNDRYGPSFLDDMHACVNAHRQ
ncbi:hypothetical protein N5079_30425 [Planotetraspora sp. A-T 1434]|uniref:hypothetical protein n=1 Tax=Planotetraspora sp. A-T 1434 TaxID=2979219 RepID=UPI0021BFE2BD|nr:hypothetical protein [Planotetraspora sp. A-T 1434]MCT9934530.1 hypothetical protein [Planotetraspora sp. A-T 1434]